MPDGTDTPVQLKVLVAEDRSKAHIQVLGATSPGFVPPTIDSVVKVLEDAKIAITEAVRRRVDELVVTCTAAGGGSEGNPAPELPEAFLVAEGRPAVDAEDGRFEWSPELAEKLAGPQSREQIDYFAVNTIVTVRADTVIGRIIRPKASTPGVDVFGQERPARKPKGAPINLGPGVRLVAEDSDELIAETNGRVVEERGKVSIREVLDIPGDVDFSSGSVDACVDVVVGGTVRSNFTVRTTKSLNVHRVIEAADVDVGGDIVVRGGIFGQERAGKVRAGGTVTAQLLNEAKLEAGGDLQVNKEILNSRVRVFGRLIGERVTIIGGQTYAREGIEVRVIGSDACVATSLGTGADVNTIRRARQLERQATDLAKAADQVRQTVEPLLANMKRLLPAQRERATELLCKADEIGLQVEESRHQAQQMVKDGAPQGPPYVLIGEAAHPGTHIAIDAREVRLQKLLHGPVKIEFRKVDAVTEVVAVNQRTGSVTVLPSTEVDLDAPPTDDPEETDRNEGANEPTAHHQCA